MVVKEVCTSIHEFSIANESRVYLATAREIQKVLTAILVNKEQFSNYIWDLHPVKKAVIALIKDFDKSVLPEGFDNTARFIKEIVIRFSEFNAKMQQYHPPTFIRALEKFIESFEPIRTRVEAISVAANVSNAFLEIHNSAGKVLAA